jgi:hypothetical protein
MKCNFYLFLILSLLSLSFQIENNSKTQNDFKIKKDSYLRKEKTKSNLIDDKTEFSQRKVNI